jgi:hypothetical protein
MAFANFGILQAMPDPYERIRQASQGWGALPGVVGGLQKQWAEEKLKDVHGRVMGAWDFQHEADSNPEYQFASPEEKAQYEANRAIFKPGETDSQKFRKAAQLYSPYDSALSQKMLGMADVRDREEAQLQDEMNQRIAAQKAKEEEAKAKLPYENTIRGERAFDALGSQIADLYQRRDNVNPNDVATLKLIDDAIQQKRAQQDVVREANKGFAKGSALEAVYAEPAAAPVAPPVVPATPASAPVAPVIPTLAQSSDLARAKLSVDQMVQAGTISPDEATRQKTALEVQAGELSRKEGAAAGARKQSETLATTALKDSGFNGNYESRTEYNTAAKEVNNLLANIEKATDADINSLAVMVAKMEGAKARANGVEAIVKEEDAVRDLMRSIGFQKGATAEEKRSYINAMKKRVDGWREGYDTTYKSALDAIGDDKTARAILEKKYKGAGLWAGKPQATEPKPLKPLSPEMRKRLGL